VELARAAAETKDSILQTAEPGLGAGPSMPGPRSREDTRSRLRVGALRVNCRIAGIARH
jgi:hypothetical protein